MLAEYGLAESAKIVSDAFNGNQDAIAQAMGRQEAMNFVTAMAGGAYSDFATAFGSTMNGITKSSKAIQTQSYESKVARLNAATDTLQIRIGADINRIKGFFVDMGAGFLTHAVAPMVNSPIGPVFTNLAAGVGLAAKGVLDVGSGVLNTAAQFSVLTANIKNSEGFAKLFKSSLQLLGAPFKAVGTMVGGFITNLFGIGASSGVAAAGTGTLGVTGAGAAGGIGAAAGATSAFATSLWAATWPILAVVAGVALIAGGVYLLVKNWSAVSGFFVGLWQNITGAFSAAWDWIKNTIMGTSDWILAGVAVFMPIIGIPALIIKHWDGIKTFFVDLWNDPKTTIMGFIDWIGGKVEAFTAPFRAIGDTVSGIFGKIGGFFKGLAGDGAVSGAQMNTAFAGGIQANAQAPTQAFSQSLTGIDAMMPHSDAHAGPLSRLSASGRALTETFASGMESDPLGDKAAQVFQSALPLSLITGTSNVAGSSLVPQTPTSSALPVPSFAGEGFPTPDLELNLPIPALTERSGTALGTPVSKENADGEGPLVVHIQNFTLNANDLEEAFDMLRQLRHITQSPQEAAV
jgi:hypothetical protein